MTSNFTVRLPSAVRQLLANVASMHGRTTGAEARIAVELHCVRTLLERYEDRLHAGTGATEEADELKANLEAEVSRLENLAQGRANATDLCARLLAKQRTN